MSDFCKKMPDFWGKKAKNTAFSRENTRFHAKMGVFRDEKRFSQNFRGKKRPRHVESVPESVHHVKSAREASETLFTKKRQILYLSKYFVYAI